jgi:hypothetical protein
LLAWHTFASIGYNSNSAIRVVFISEKEGTLILAAAFPVLELNWRKTHADYDFANRCRYYDGRIGGSRANHYSAKQWSWCSRLAGGQVRSRRETGRAKSHSIRTGPEQSSWVARKQIRASTTKAAQVSESHGRRFGGLLFVRHDWPNIRKQLRQLCNVRRDPSRLVAIITI